MAERTCELKEDALLFYKGAHFTNRNITDKVATAILKSNPKNENSFVAYPKGYEVKSDGALLADAKIKLAHANQDVKKIRKEIVKVTKEIEKKAGGIEQLQEAYKLAQDNVKAGDDDKKEALTEIAEQAGKELEEALEGVDGSQVITKLNEQLEETESDVVKYQSLLNKRDK